CFAEIGHHVHLVDIDAAKIAALESGHIPIYEPGLKDLVQDNHRASRLHFTTDAKAAVADADACFICVGTPSRDDGHADLRYVETVARTIGALLTGFTVIVTKSTVPVGTAKRVREWVREGMQEQGKDIDFAVASNPEFLKEGAAVEDFMRPDRVIIGTDDERAGAVLRDIYSGFMRNGFRFYDMDIPSAEMAKYTANSMLATKISFINEIANICEHVGADVNMVRQGVGADQRIGMQFLHPGVGYGGSCFPKDVRELIATAEDAGYAPRMLRATDAINSDQRGFVFRKIRAWCELTGRTPGDLSIAVWGLAFKPFTDDVRESPALELIEALLAEGATVRAHDPHAIEPTRRLFGPRDRLTYYEDPYDTTAGADILCLMTEWRPYRRPDMARLGEHLRHRVVFDGRNQYDAQRWSEHGITVYGVGCGPRLAASPD
ncbi:MAG: UDP-glucose dehydrogenase family protein, partial [Planctomycetota bacterium]